MGRDWIRLATNLARNHFRSEARRRRAYATVAAQEQVGQNPGNEEETFLQEARDRVESAVASLPPKQRMAFTLRKLHGLEYQAIGEMLQCSAQAARANVFQAFRKLRRVFNQLEATTAEGRR